MTDKEKIRVEIERLKESGCASPIVICDTLLAFIDSMQEEPLIEDLEEEWNRYITSEEYLKDIPGGLPVARHFAKWQKSQLSKCSCELKILEYEDMPTTGSIQLDFPKGIFKAGEKIKLLIIKEDKT